MRKRRSFLQIIKVKIRLFFNPIKVKCFYPKCGCKRRDKCILKL